MKQCSTCREVKALDQFNAKKRNKDGLERYCRTCHKIKNRKHYLNNRDTYIKSANKWRNTMRAWWLEYKQTLKCEICAESRHWVLDFHHKDPREKDFAVSKMIVNSMSKELILIEISKCIVVCRNCHADIHYKKYIPLV